MPTSGNVLALLPVLTPYTPTSAQFRPALPYALDEFEGDDPGCSKTGAERALAYLMAHYLAGGEDQIGFSGEKIDDYSYTVAGPATTSSRWYVLYRQQTRPVPRRTRHRPGSARRRPARGRLRAF